MKKRVIIHAVNVHQGGGRKLLEGLLQTIDADFEYIFTLDERLPLPSNLCSNIKVRRVRPSIFQRLRAEIWLRWNAKNDDCVLCFGNLPPLFRLRASTNVLVQNRYLIDNVSLQGLSLGTRGRISVERLWLKYALSHADQYLVQTPSMRALMESLVGQNIPIFVVPFVALDSSCNSDLRMGRPSESAYGHFVYVASGEHHKNHKKLLEAWIVLARQDIYPELSLTVDCKVFPELCHLIAEKTARFDLKIRNLGHVEPAAMNSVYLKSDALIYPSTFESFGLPLIEARMAGIPILASELDYVRDLVDPEQSFNPESAVSIAKAVKRFLGEPAEVLSINTPAEFMAHLLSGTT